MLPSSHLLLINSSEPREGRWSAESSLVSSVAGDVDIPGLASRQLADAFSQFVFASSQLESSYRRLQGEIAELRLELAKRNAVLQSTIADNERIRRHLEQTVSCMPCGVLVLDGDGVIQLANPESRRLLGLQSAGLEREALVLAGISAASQVDLHQILQLATDQESIQEICIRGKENVRWLEVRIRRFQESPGDVPCDAKRAIVILRDITAKKRAEQEREIGRRAFALAEVSSEVAHEIRNPLAALELFAELIEQDDAQRSTWISHLRAGIRSLSATVNNVLSLRSGTFKLEAINLEEALGAALSFVRPLIAQAQLTVDWEKSEMDRIVLGCRAAIQQIVLNLVTNAIRHTPAGGTVEIRLCQEQRAERGVTSDYVVLQFADSGSGIPADHIDRIFEAGFSGSGTTSGLGLAVCERIMREHGGMISVRNRAEGGAQFDVAFPIHGKGICAA